LEICTAHFFAGATIIFSDEASLEK
jgi:hypothetical protein